MRGTWLAAILLLAGLGGCMGDDGPDYDRIQNEVEAQAQAYLQDAIEDPDVVFDPSRHTRGVNLRRVAYHNGFDGTGVAGAIPAGGYYHEVAVTDQYAYLTRQSEDGDYGGFSILNLRKLANGTPEPFLVSHFDGQPGSDIEVTHDEAFAFFATQRNTIEQMAGGVASTQDPASAASRGVYVVDIRDKSNPSLETFLPVPYNGAHTITYHRHSNGNEYLVATSYDLYTSASPSGTAPGGPFPFGVVPATQRVEVFQFVRALVPGLPAQLLRVSQFQITENAPVGALFFPHDTSVQVHPERNRTLLYVAYWDKGVRILDFQEPEQPLQEIGAWNDFSPSAENAIHWVRSFPHRIDGRHITVAEPEIVTAPEETGYITFLDTSDPESPRKAARDSHWTIPIEGLGVRMLEFSPHNFDLWDGKVVLAHYHGGIWVIDVSTRENLARPTSVAFTFDTEPRTDNPRPTPMFWSAFEHGGLIYAVDEGTGLYVYEYLGP